jgi:hypothetical protein
MDWPGEIDVLILGAIRFLLEATARQQGLSLPQEPLFWDEWVEEKAMGPQSVRMNI